MTNNLNYQQIYEEELSEHIKSSLELPSRFYELSHQQRMMIEELVDFGAREAIAQVLDPEVLQETAALAGEMGAQLYNFANMIQSQTDLDDDDRRVWPEPGDEGTT